MMRASLFSIHSIPTSTLVWLLTIQYTSYLRCVVFLVMAILVYYILKQLQSQLPRM